LDEPTIGLDPHGARALRAFVREELCLRRGATVLYTTHAVRVGLVGAKLWAMWGGCTMRGHIFGRESELETSEVFLDATADGPAFLLVRRAQGIGKTTLFSVVGVAFVLMGALALALPALIRRLFNP